MSFEGRKEERRLRLLSFCELFEVVKFVEIGSNQTRPNLLIGRFGLVWLGRL